MTTIKVTTSYTPGPPLGRKCEGCGKRFYAKNVQAAEAMRAGKLRLCDACRRNGGRPRPAYSEYLKSAGWQTRRAAALKRAGHRCQVCNGDKRLEVHHRTYERLGHERAADLVVLCRDCHQLFHDNGRLEG